MVGPRKNERIRHWRCSWPAGTTRQTKNSAGVATLIESAPRSEVAVKQWWLSSSKFQGSLFLSMLPRWRANTVNLRNLHSSYTFSSWQFLLIYDHIIKGHQKVRSSCSFRIRMLFSFAVTLLCNLKHYYMTIDNYLWKKKTTPQVK